MIRAREYLKGVVTKRHPTVFGIVAMPRVMHPSSIGAFLSPSFETTKTSQFTIHDSSRTLGIILLSSKINLFQPRLEFFQIRSQYFPSHYRGDHGSLISSLMDCLLLDCLEYEIHTETSTAKLMKSCSSINLMLLPSSHTRR